MRVIIRTYLILTLALTCLAGKAKGVQIVHLSCDYMENPLAVEREYPLLKWELLSDEKEEVQAAYRIIVSSSEALIKKNRGDYWDSGKISSSKSIIQYEGKTLSSRTKVYWKVMVWNGKDEASEWSDVSHWQMGLLQPQDWIAKWIGQRVDEFPDSTLVFPAPYLRKHFALSKHVKKAIVYVSGLGFYEMYINGRKIGDQVLAPAVTNYDKRSLKNLLYHYDDQSTQRVFYNVFDVTANVQSKDNAIGVILGNGWYNQRDRKVEGYMWYDVPKMLLQLEIEYEDGSKKTIVSDDSWKATTGPLLHDAIFTGEVYDARLELQGWNMGRYNDEKWGKALEVRAPTGKLMVQTAPFNNVMDTVHTTFERINDSVYTYVLPKTVSGWGMLRVRGKAGDSVKLRFVSEEGLDYGQKDTYILDGDGEEEWEPRFTWHTFRKVEITAKGVEIDPQSLTVKSIYTNVDQTGTFESSNELLNRIHRAWVRTMHANFKGIVSSDPHRERLAYTGDGQVITESLLYTFDMSRFLRKFIDDIADARNKNTGYVPHTAPFSGGGGGPAWGSAYVIIPWNYYRHYGDLTVLRDNYQGMKQWVTYLGTRTDDRGIVVREEPNGWCLGDWCTPYNIIEIPPEFVNTAFYYHVTRTMVEMAELVGNQADKVELQELAQKIKRDFNTVFYDAQTNHYWKGKQGTDAIALAFGLVPDENKEKVFAAMLKHLENINYHFDTGIFGTPLTLKVLTENGRADIAYKLMNQKDFPGFGYLMDDKNSTLWETWDGGVDDPNGSGRCHPMFGSVVAWLYSTLAGIKPDETHPGMQSFVIEPTPIGDLSYCRASYKSVYGTIVSDWELDKQGNFRLDVSIPANTQATIIFPVGVEGTLYESGVKINQGQRVKVGETNRIKTELGSGTFSFLVRR